MWCYPGGGGALKSERLKAASPARLGNLLGFRFAAVAARAIPVEEEAQKMASAPAWPPVLFAGQTFESELSTSAHQKSTAAVLRCHFFERNTGFGPATSGLGSARSTN